MPDPVAEHIADLEQQIRSLQGDLDRVVRERNAGTELTVKLEDSLNGLREERAGLIRGLRHLYQHLTASLNDRTELSGPCEQIHPFVQEYVRDIDATIPGLKANTA